MSDLNDDLLNYELGDDIDDQALYGADEDELLLSDDEVESEVSKEERRQLKAEAEEWANAQVKKEKLETTVEESLTTVNLEPIISNDKSVIVTSTVEKITEVTKVTDDVLNAVSTTEECITSETVASHVDEVTSSSSKVQEDEQLIYSGSGDNDYSSIKNSQQLGNVASDPCDDFEEQGERTNIKITNERDVATSSSDFQEIFQPRFPQTRRGNQIRPPQIVHGHQYYSQRPAVRFPPHCNFQHIPPNFPPVPNMPAPGPPGIFPLPQQQFPPNLSHVPISSIAAPSHMAQDQINSSLNQNQRLPFPSYRQSAAINYRPQAPNMYSHTQTNPGLPFNQNYRPPVSRPIYHPDTAGIRPGMRLQRPPLQALPAHTLHQSYANPTICHQAQQSQQAPLELPQCQTLKTPHSSGSTSMTIAPSLSSNNVRPSKVLINPNFKGGVEAATHKFIQDTQYMKSINSHAIHLQSDEELLRQQEEFINKNRQHIEKRRNERPATSRRSRSRSRSRTRSRSRERSYTPPRRSGGDRRSDRFSDRDIRDRTWNTDYRDRGTIGGTRESRVRKGTSREREYENRNFVNYSKRKRSPSPIACRKGYAEERINVDNEKKYVEEDEETRAYRLEIEKQKAIREKVYRDKELKRLRAAKEKQNEEKQDQTCKTDVDTQKEKCGPLAITKSKIISLKKSNKTDTSIQPQQEQTKIPKEPFMKKHIPTAKILPEAKRTLTDHLVNVTASSNTAVIKPVQKNDAPSSDYLSTKDIKTTRLLSTPSDDEVVVDYDELMLEEEDRLLASPTPSPPPTRDVSRTPSPRPQAKGSDAGIVRESISKAKTVQVSPFVSSNRRVILKTCRHSDSESRNYRNDRSNVNTDNNSSSARRGVFDRLDIRRQQQNNGSSATCSSENKRRMHRNEIKHN